jgi:4-diphosphocytidyl-2-C-methyl-D-erythritol kinase
MICFPNCKINIGLNVIEKRKDGFHNIETVFYPVALSDALEIIESKKLTVITSGLKITGETNDNLCVKAYRLIADEYKIPAVKIILHKAVPSGAGLGGGSSDAASMLLLLNKFFSLNISENRISQFAARLGSDCAFFIRNAPVFAFGRGEKIKEIQLSLRNYHLIIIKPDFEISTAKAYSLVTPKAATFSLKELSAIGIKEWKKFVVNDFENAVFKMYPEIKKIKEKLYSSGAVYASMTGSGSAVYGIFKDEPGLPAVPKTYFTWKGLL